MQSLQDDFLTKLATEYDLSPEQKEAFVKRFSCVSKNEQQVAEELHISAGAFRTRMTGVYGKFSIKGKGPGKFDKLRNFLVGKFQGFNSSETPDAQKKDLDINILLQEVREKIKPYIEERCGKM